MNAWDDLSDKARWYLENFDELALAEMLAGVLNQNEKVTAGTPLICSDERHAAKVAALEAELAATADDLRWALDLLHEHIHAPGPVDEDGELCDYCVRMARARQRLGDGPCAVDVRVSVDPPSSFYSDETTLSVQYAGGQVFKVLACRACGMAQHFGISCEDVAESRRTFAELVDAAVAQVLDGSCDHRDPNRLGHRPSDLATVCACGEVVFPSPLPFGPGSAGHYGPKLDSLLVQKVGVGPSSTEVRARVFDLLGRHNPADFQLLRDHEDRAIADSLTAAGFNVIRTTPTDEVAVNIGTLGRLRAAFDAIGQDPWSPGQVGSLTGWNVVVDDRLPDGDVHFRPTSATHDADAQP